MKASSRGRGGSAFTLIELLVVITIVIFLIAVLSQVFLKAKAKAMAAAAKGDISNLAVALKAYYADMDFYPGHDDSPGTDSAAKMYEALFGKRAVDGGGGGLNAPYHQFPEDRIQVKGGPTGYRPASPEEREDPTVEKFIVDPWYRPFHYVENDSKPEKTPGMHRPYEFDIWSNGPDGEDNKGEGDDVAPWKK